MRISLIVGAVFCSIIGLFFGYYMLRWITEYWWRLLSKPQERDLFDLLLGAIFIGLAFAPAIMLIRLRRVEKPKWRLIFIGANELVVVGMYLNMLLKAFVGWAN
ncbi:MAG TPA: hypothetical protein VNX46_04890 [Candidatus Acidoferrum sp.]|jgi:hypothetical protein|nr:hypothetical protein [Candidatus Acidoferrum sp.]